MAALEWVPVSERLPPDREWVLVLTVQGLWDRGCLNHMNHIGVMEWYLPSGPVEFDSGFVTHYAKISLPGETK